MGIDTPTITKPGPEDQAFIHGLAAALLSQAQQRGLVVTITRAPLQPLAMGHEADVVQVYADREHR